MARSAQLARLLKRLGNVKDAPRKAILPAMVRGAFKIAETQRHFAPVDSGDLRDSITVTLPGTATPAYSQPGGQTVAGPEQVLITAGDHEVRYAHLIEYGTAHTAAQPFFFPGLRANRKRVQSSIDRAGRKSIRDAWKAT